jgi:hypothetical protein
MFHTLLDSLRADCRCSPESRLLAGTSGLPAKPPPETSARRSGKILRLAWAGGGFSGVGGLTISLRKGGFALARIYRDYRHHKNCQQTNDRGDGEDCEICGLVVSAGLAVPPYLSIGAPGRRALPIDPRICGRDGPPGRPF